MRENRNNKKKTREYRIHESRERQTEWNKYSGKQLNMLFINEMDIRFFIFASMNEQRRNTK